METCTPISSICDKFLSVAATAPEAIALSSGSDRMTYGELERKSAQIAGCLRESGISHGGTVVLCMERSFAWIVSALGAMRAGAAYVPLDQGWAKDRLRFAIQDSGASLIFAKKKLLADLNLGVKGFDPEIDLPVGKEAASELDGGEGDALAYVIYTSGSTGVPKGVEITHANLASLIEWHEGAFDLKPTDRTSFLAGLGFDAAVWELWPSLATGATVCVAPESVRSSPELLREWLIKEEITVSFVPTGLATGLISKAWPASTRLRLLLTGGDTLPHGPIDGLPFSLINNYGPTECTVVATSGVIPAGHTGTPTIGREIAGTSVYLLNGEGEPVADGEQGEIYIGGNSVGRGYRNLVEQTELHFVRDPFAGGSQGRMYKTGDLAVRLQNGQLEFKGRSDRQAKIRGQRVELDEIGSVLGRHAEVAFATATILLDERGENQLVGYVLPKDALTVLTTAELQEYLLLSLPAYMIPSVFVRLETRPLSLNGKVDLKLLERPTEANVLRAKVARGPSSPLEEQLLLMVQDILGMHTATVEDDFFFIGGHSLIGMQLVLRLRESFGVDFTLRQLFQSSTVEQLAVSIEAMLLEEVEGLTDEEAGMQLAE